MVFQDYALWPHLTVRKNVAFPLANTELSKSERDKRCSDLLERVGIEHLAERYPNQLSGGEQQRVALARALAADVGLILFDEPLSNLDADRREQLRIEIATLTREAGRDGRLHHARPVRSLRAGRPNRRAQSWVASSSSTRPKNIYAKPTNAFVARFTGVAGEFPVDVVREVASGHHEVVLPFAAGHVLASHRVRRCGGQR